MQHGLYLLHARRRQHYPHRVLRTVLHSEGGLQPRAFPAASILIMASPGCAYRLLLAQLPAAESIGGTCLW